MSKWFVSAAVLVVAACQASAQPGARVTSAAATVVPAAIGFRMMAELYGRDASVRASETAFAGAIMWGGLVVGPAVGYATHGRLDGAKRGLVWRTSAFVVASLIGYTETEDMQDGIYPNPETDRAGIWVPAIAIILTSGVIDIVKANERVKRSRVSLAPWRGPNASRGVIMSFSF